MQSRDILDNPSPSDFEIARLGACKLPTPVRGRTMVADDERVSLWGRVAEIERALAEGKALVGFEKAGPREHLFHDPSWTKAAIVTCGGLCPGINDVIKSLVQILHFDYGVRTIYGVRYGYEGLIPSFQHEPVLLDPIMATNIHDAGGTILGSSRGAQDIGEMVDTLERMNINMLFCIGGDGTLRGASAIAHEARKRGSNISVVGVPKTIDNDLSFVGRCFGFETAVYRTADVIRSAYVEAMGAHRGIGLVKLMGRDSGFIAAYASLATSVVDICLIPEQTLTLEGEGGLFAALDRRLGGEQKWAVVVVAEGAGQDLFANFDERRDKSGNVLKHDIGERLREDIRDHFAERGQPVSIKYFDPSYLIRSAPAQGLDAIFCAQLAENAVHAAFAGRTDVVIGQWHGCFTHVPIRLATLERQRLATDSAIWHAVLGATRQRDYFEPADQRRIRAVPRPSN